VPLESDPEPVSLENDPESVLLESEPEFMLLESEPEFMLLESEPEFTLLESEPVFMLLESRLESVFCGVVVEQEDCSFWAPHKMTLVFAQAAPFVSSASIPIYIHSLIC
jgi:hypothetical protein